MFFFCVIRVLLRECLGLGLGLALLGLGLGLGLVTFGLGLGLDVCGLVNITGQPTLDPNAETFISVQCAMQPRERRGIGRCSTHISHM